MTFSKIIDWVAGPIYCLLMIWMGVSTLIDGDNRWSNLDVALMFFMVAIWGLVCWVQNLHNSHLKEALEEAQLARLRDMLRVEALLARGGKARIDRKTTTSPNGTVIEEVNISSEVQKGASLDDVEPTRVRNSFN